MINKSDLFPIGIGTWGIGGLVDRDESIDEQKQINAIAHMLDSGMNFVEANLWYSQGYAVEILKKAIDKSSKKRDDLFICQSVYLFNRELHDLEVEVDQLLTQLGTDHLDTLQLLQDSFTRYEFEQIVTIVDELIDKDKTRFSSITNEDLPLLKKYHQHFGHRLFSHEVGYNFEIRANETEGIIPYADQHQILTVVYQPLRRNRTARRNWPLLVSLAQKYDASQNQIIMAWLTSKGYLPITKSETISHIDEHLAALKIKLTDDDIQQLDHFSPPGYQPPKIDWRKSGEGVRADQLSNVFDELYDQQLAAHSP